MKTLTISRPASAWCTAALLLAVWPAAQAQSAAAVYYICPGNVFTNTLTAKEA